MPTPPSDPHLTLPPVPPPVRQDKLTDFLGLMNEPTLAVEVQALPGPPTANPAQLSPFPSMASDCQLTKHTQFRRLGPLHRGRGEVVKRSFLPNVVSVHLLPSDGGVHVAPGVPRRADGAAEPPGRARRARVLGSTRHRRLPTVTDPGSEMMMVPRTCHATWTNVDALDDRCRVE
jgi:hypothetical protein